MRSSRWQIVLAVYFILVFIFNKITGHAVEVFISHELFILFFVMASSRAWSRREINMLLNAVIAACNVQALAVLFSNSLLLHAGSQQHINYLWISTNRNPIAFAIVPGAAVSLLKFLFTKDRFKTSFLRVYWIFSFILCSYDVFAIGCRSAFYSLCLGISCLIFERVRGTRNRTEKYIQELLILILVIVGAVVLVRVASGAYSERLFSLEDTGRRGIWEDAMELIRKKPFFGGGYDYWESAGYIMGTHNTFITYLLEGGVIAAFITAGHFLFLGFEIQEVGFFIPFTFLVEALMHTFTETTMDYYAYLPMLISLVLNNYLRYQGSIWKLFNG